MSIEKKSLISNRTATKKAILAKPEVSNVGATRVTLNKASVNRLAPPCNKIAMNAVTMNKIGMNKIALSKVSMSKVAVSKVKI